MPTKKHRDLKIAGTFMLAEKYEDATPTVPCIVMPKLNGIRAMYCPQRGFFTRDGIQYCPEVLSHIWVESSIPVDGEFYVHGWSLQRINAAVGVNLIAPVADSRAVKFHAFDVVQTRMPAWERTEFLANIVADSQNVELVQHLLTFPRRFDYWHEWHVKDGYEGTMYKHADRGYTPGRTVRLVKRKDWKFIQVVVQRIREGEGKFRGMFGGAEVYSAENPNLRFNVGVGKDLTDAVRRALWADPKLVLGKPFRARYLTLSDDGIPQNSTIKIELT